MIPGTTGTRFSAVVVLNPPSPPGYFANRDSHGGYGQLYPSGATIIPPLDVPYLVAYLEEKKVPVEVIEAQGFELTREEVAERVARIAHNSPGRTLIVARTALPSLDWDLSVCAGIKSAAGDVGIAVFGSIVGHVLHRIYKEACVDYVLRGEPDDAVFELVSGSPEQQIQGLNYRRNGN